MRDEVLPLLVPALLGYQIFQDNKDKKFKSIPEIAEAVQILLKLPPNLRKERLEMLKKPLKSHLTPTEPPVSPPKSSGMTF